MSAPRFAKAVRRKSKLRLALSGPSGSGKTWGALMIAKALGGSIAVIDSEKGSASLYTHLADFDVLELSPPFTPEAYREAIKAAAAAGYDNLIIDSITHEWNGLGGCLELVDQIAAAKYRGNSWSAWNDVTPRHRDFVDTLLSYPGHVIATMRSKTETAQVEGDNGRKKVVKLGMKTEQRDGTDYEFTVVLDIIHAGHYATASKDRTGLFTDKDPQPITEATGAMLMEWLNSGADALPPAPPPAPRPPPPAPEPEPEPEPDDRAPPPSAARRRTAAEPPPPPPPPSNLASRATTMGKLSASEAEMHCLAIESCDTVAELDKAWKDAKTACRKVGDTDAYTVLKGVMERVANVIKEAAAQPH